jgi:molybdate transport system substrate-binding protein
LIWSSHPPRRWLASPNPARFPGLASISQKSASALRSERARRDPISRPWKVSSRHCGPQKDSYIDPAAGGSSGIYVSGLLDRLGIGAEVRPKSVLVRGGYSADRVASGEAELAVQQISELLPVKGVVLVGPLPAEIQSYTVYSAGIAADTPRMPAARALISLLRSPEGTAAIRSKGMEPAGDAPAKPQ